MITPTEEQASFVTRAKDAAKEQIAEGFEVRPVVITFAPQRIGIALDFSSEQTKQQCAIAVRTILRNLGADWYVFCTESWARFEPIEPGAVDLGAVVVPDPANPETKEVVVLLLGTPAGAAQWMAEIQRAPDSATLAEFEGPSEASLTLFGDLLMPRSRA